MTFKFDEETFKSDFFKKYNKNDDISLELYIFAEEYLAKKTIFHNKNVIKYYYGKKENAIKVFEKNWGLEFYKDCQSKGNKTAYIELGAITLYKVFYKEFSNM